VRISIIEVGERKVAFEHYGGCKLRPDSTLTIYGNGEPKTYCIHEDGKSYGIPFEVNKALANKFFTWENFDEILDDVCRNPAPGCAFVAFHRESAHCFFISLREDGKTLTSGINVIIVSPESGPYGICVTRDGWISHPRASLTFKKARISIKTHIMLLRFVAKHSGNWDIFERRETIRVEHPDIRPMAIRAPRAFRGIAASMEYDNY
jgi:hypothetical protein